MDYSSSAATLKNKAHTPGCRTGVAKLRRWDNDRCWPGCQHGTVTQGWGVLSCHKPPDTEDELVRAVLEITDRQKMICELVGGRREACVCVCGVDILTEWEWYAGHLSREGLGSIR